MVYDSLLSLNLPLLKVVLKAKVVNPENSSLATYFFFGPLLVLPLPDLDRPD